MEQIVVLGSASAVPTLKGENTHILIQAGDACILVDCPGTPFVRLAQAGIDPVQVTDIILTHFHPDHVSGFVPLLMSMWLVGRKNSLNVYGLEPTIQRARQMLDLYEWTQWPNFYPVNFINIPGQELSPVIETAQVRVLASPVKHLIPTVGLRVEFTAQNKVMAYSCDTEPSTSVARLAKDADILIHEATGASVGHTSPEQAGEVARTANVKELYLIHYSSQKNSPESILDAARKNFSGPVHLARDFQIIPVG